MNLKFTFALSLVTAALAGPRLRKNPPQRGRCGRQRTGQGRGRCCGGNHRPGGGHRQGDAHVTLKGPKGNVVDVVAGDEVKNFDQIKAGRLCRRALRRGAHARAEEDQARVPAA